jgi:hypothetical protein
MMFSGAQLGFVPIAKVSVQKVMGKTAESLVEKLTCG